MQAALQLALRLGAALQGRVDLRELRGVQCPLQGVAGLAECAFRAELVGAEGERGVHVPQALRVEREPGVAGEGVAAPHAGSELQRELGLTAGEGAACSEVGVQRGLGVGAELRGVELPQPGAQLESLRACGGQGAAGLQTAAQRREQQLAQMHGVTLALRLHANVPARLAEGGLNALLLCAGVDHHRAGQAGGGQLAVERAGVELRDLQAGLQLGLRPMQRAADLSASAQVDEQIVRAGLLRIAREGGAQAVQRQALLVDRAGQGVAHAQTAHQPLRARRAEIELHIQRGAGQPCGEGRGVERVRAEPGAAQRCGIEWREPGLQAGAGGVHLQGAVEGEVAQGAAGAQIGSVALSRLAGQADVRGAQARLQRVGCRVAQAGAELGVGPGGEGGELRAVAALVVVHLAAEAAVRPQRPWRADLQCADGQMVDVDTQRQAQAGGQLRRAGRGGGLGWRHVDALRAQVLDVQGALPQRGRRPAQPGVVQEGGGAGGGELQLADAHRVPQTALHVFQGDLRAAQPQRRARRKPLQTALAAQPSHGGCGGDQHGDRGRQRPEQDAQQARPAAAGLGRRGGDGCGRLGHQNDSPALKFRRYWCTA